MLSTEDQKRGRKEEKTTKSRSDEESNQSALRWPEQQGGRIINAEGSRFLTFSP
jgi:hypothetical protein